MSVPHLSVCPGTLATGFSTYSPVCRKRLFEGKAVPHVLNMPSPRHDDATMALFMDNMKRISISGVQNKISLVQEGKKLRLTRPGEQGTHILKPIPGTTLKRVAEVPANEHLTMQLAAQVYRIPTAANALIFFSDGEPAYITRRFDVRRLDPLEKWGQEDFASLAGKTTYQSDEKYDSNYEDAARLIRQYVPAWRVEMEKYFVLVVFNYLFSNGDAHLKNFSLVESTAGDFLLSPAYDLINTHLHVDDTPFALSGGLFADGYKSRAFQSKGAPGKADFETFAQRIGITASRISKLLAPFQEKQEVVETLVQRSFLSDTAKRGYLLRYRERRNLLAG